MSLVIDIVLNIITILIGLGILLVGFLILSELKKGRMTTCELLSEYREQTQKQHMLSEKLQAEILRVETPKAEDLNIGHQKTEPPRQGVVICPKCYNAMPASSSTCPHCKSVVNGGS